MSLFKARDWWSTVSGYEEFHTNRQLVVTSLDPNSLQYDECIFVGSFSGMLRAYRPHYGEYTPDDLLLEKQLNGPIIQLAIEHVIEDVVNICLIVLHPRSVVYYSLVIDDQNTLSIVTKYSHSLSHTSYSMIIGPFGRTVDHELLCIQSMDSVLTILDHNDMLFSCNLPNFVLPGPMGYNPRTDTLVTVGSCRQLETYRYQSLLSSDTRKTKSILSEWCIELGEESIDIKVVIHEDGPSLILILCERNIYCIKDDSSLLFSKKLEQSFTVLHPYKTENIDNQLLVYYILAGHTKQLQIMKNETLMWAAQLSHVPVAMTTANFKELNGIIVTLDELGNLQCSYLGTDPTSHAGVGGVNSKQSLEDMNKELQEVSLTIKENEDDVNQPSTNGQPLHITIVDYSKPRPVEGEEEEEKIERQCIECHIQITNQNPLITLCDININTDVTTPISVHPTTIVHPSLAGNESDTFTVTIVYSSNMLPLSMNIIITVSYTENGTIHTLDHTSSLPLELFCKPCAPQDGQYKVTVDSSLPCVNINELYINNEGKSSNALAYQLLLGSTVTIITSKTSARYRIQSDDFSVLGIFLTDLTQRLTQHHINDNQQLSLKVSSQLPLTDYYEIIDQHYKMRVGLEQCKELLSRHAHQFRAIQKRLLSHFKDKTPSGLLHLDTLLDGTYMQLMMLAEKYEDLFTQEQLYSRQLANATLLIITFLKLNGELNNDELSILNSTLVPNMPFNTEQGWEEVVDMGITQLLKSCLAKNIKDQSTSLPELIIPNDSIKIKRHIALLCDRILKGGKLAVTQSLIETTPTTLLGQLPALTEETEQTE